MRVLRDVAALLKDALVHAATGVCDALGFLFVAFGGGADDDYRHGGVLKAVFGD